MTVESLAALFLAFVHVGLSYAVRRQPMPRLAILNRWLRWILFSFVVALLFRESGWSSRPTWAIAAMAFLVWGMGETIYNWLAITAISKSDVPIFPQFKINRDGDDWPAQVRYVRIREWIRKEGFRRKQSLKARLFGEIELRSSVYDEEDGRVRLQVLFIPQSNGQMDACYVFSSQTEDEQRIITDNIFVPFGGFYPADWHLMRKPLLRNPSKLYRMHRKRLEQVDVPVVAWDDDNEPVDDLNRQQRLLEKVNTDMGFLLPAYLREEHGKFSSNGRYRVWKEIWLLNYFGVTGRGR